MVGFSLNGWMDISAPSLLLNRQDKLVEGFLVEMVLHGSLLLVTGDDGQFRLHSPILGALARVILIDSIALGF